MLHGREFSGHIILVKVLEFFSIFSEVLSTR